MFNKEDVVNIAALSKLHVKENQHEEIIGKFNDMVDFVDKIKSADISNLADKKNEDNQNITRKDEVKKGIAIEELEKLAPKFSSGHVIVPAVIE